MLSLTLTLWDHLVQFLGFLAADASIAYVFVAHFGPRLNATRTQTMLDAQRALVLSEVRDLLHGEREAVRDQMRDLLESERSTLPSVLKRPLEDQSRVLFEEVRRLMEQERETLLASLTPTEEDQERGRQALAESMSAAATAAVRSAVPAGIGAYSAAGVDSRTTFKAQEEAFLAAVMQHERGGVLKCAAIERLKDLTPAVYRLAVRAGPDHVGEFLEKNGARLDGVLAKLGLGDSGASPGLTLV
ncbi:MAG TPA: hypothetical protein VM286_05810 [Candidatus Thermoplasmatota archaeon]|nr:hypothetical protein [Candidatus Thermoplasmatota archaeon]